MGLRKKKKKAISFADKTAYLKYVKSYRGGDKQPMTLANWVKGGKKSAYFKGVDTAREEAHLSRKTRKRVGMKD